MINGDIESASESEQAPEVARIAVLRASRPPPRDGDRPLPAVRGHDWESVPAVPSAAAAAVPAVDYEALLSSYATVGFQATNLSRAAEEVLKMLECRDVALAPDDTDPHETDEFIRKRNNCTLFLGYTSNIISSGLRETILYLVKNKLVDVLVATAGGVEEDFIKCLAPTLVADWSLDGRQLRERGLNRIGNLLVPNDNYCQFEEWATPLLDEMLDDQRRDGVVWTPSKVIARLGERIADESSVYYWAWRNRIPVFSPALTDGALGDLMYFHSYRRPGLVLDVLGDLRRLNSMAVKANNSGMLILGGGVVKHHICNANLMRNGADYAIFINTGTEYDGSDAGARPDEAVSWGKIRASAAPVKVHADATLVFPLLVAQTFAKHHQRRLQRANEAVPNGGKNPNGCEPSRCCEPMKPSGWLLSEMRGHPDVEE